MECHACRASRGMETASLLSGGLPAWHSHRVPRGLRDLRGVVVEDVIKGPGIVCLGVGHWELR
jgi:hypothetical protein